MEIHESKFRFWIFILRILWIILGVSVCCLVIWKQKQTVDKKITFWMKFWTDVSTNNYIALYNTSIFSQLHKHILKFCYFMHLIIQVNVCQLWCYFNAHWKTNKFFTFLLHNCYIFFIFRLLCITFNQRKRSTIQYLCTYLTIWI